MAGAQRSNQQLRKQPSRTNAVAADDVPAAAGTYGPAIMGDAPEAVAGAPEGQQVGGVPYGVGQFYQGPYQVGGWVPGAYQPNAMVPQAQPVEVPLGMDDLGQAVKEEGIEEPGRPRGVSLDVIFIAVIVSLVLAAFVMLLMFGGVFKRIGPKGDATDDFELRTTAPRPLKSTAGGDSTPKHVETKPTAKTSSASTSAASSTEIPYRRPKRKVCYTDACWKKARMIVAAINSTLDPCDDFYEYMCQRKIQQLRHNHRTGGDFYRTAVETRKAAEDLLRTMSWRGIENTAIGKVLIAYQACQKSVPDDQSLEELRNFMARIGIEQWPIWPPSDDAPLWNETLVKMADVLGFTSIFDIDIEYEFLDDVKQYYLHIVWDDYNDLFRSYSYEKLLQYKDYMKSTIMLMNSSFGERDATALAEELYHFEDSLHPFHRNTPYTEKVDLGQSTEIDWRGLFNQILGLINDSYADKEGAVLYTGSVWFPGIMWKVLLANRSIVHNYLGWTVLYKLGSLASDTLRTLHVNYTGAPSYNCFRDMNMYVRFIVDRIYINNQLPADVRKDTHDIAYAMRRSMREMVMQNTWLTNVSKLEALKKLDKLVLQVGYPSQVLNDTFIEEYVEPVGDITTDTPYLLIQNSLRVNRFKRILKKVNMLLNREEYWSATPGSVHGEVLPTLNTIRIGAPMLRTPLYDFGLPWSCNVGVVGFVIAHEIAHLYEHRVRDFDADGRYRNPYDKESSDKFGAREKCFVDQYNAIFNEETGHWVQGGNTLGENVADNLGLAVAFKAYKDYVAINEDFALPGLEDVTDMRLFFMAFGMVFCNARYAKETLEIMLHGTHALAEYRANVPLMNLPSFSETFKCPPTSKMNIEKRCAMFDWK